MTIRNNFARNINISWHIDKERRYIITNVIIKKENVSQVINSLLGDNNKNVLKNMLNFLEDYKKLDIKIDKKWILKIIQKYNPNSKSELNDSIIHFFLVTYNETITYLEKEIQFSKNSKIKYNSIFIVGEMKKFKPEISALFKSLLLKESDEKIRSAIITALAKIKDDNLVNVLIEILEKDPSAEVRYNCAYALGELRNDFTVESLIKALDDKNPYVQEKAAEALGKMEEISTQTKERLERLVTDPQREWRVVKAAAKALARFRTCDLIPKLIDLMTNDFDVEKRKVAIEIIGYLDSYCENTIEVMTQLIDLKENDPEESIRIIAIKILKKMCERQNLTLDDCIKAIKPNVDRRDEFWKNRDISEFEVFFDKCSSEKIHDKILLVIYFLTFLKRFEFVIILDIYSILRYLNIKISSSQTEKEVTHLLEQDFIQKYEGGYRLTKKGREKSDELLNMENKTMSANSTHSTRVSIIHEEITKTAFIAYSWDSEEHKEWVLNFATKLQENGVSTYLDQWFLKYGVKLQNYMNKIDDVDFILVICTANYNKQLKKPNSGAYYEGSIISGIMLTGGNEEKIVPIYLEGPEVCPPFIKGKWGVVIKDKNNYDEELEELLKHIFDSNPIKPPPLGKPPNFY